MILYHGSNVEIKEPHLNYSRKSLDFGAGFYTTSDFKQAEKWAKRTATLRNAGKACVSVFETDEIKWAKLSIFKFESANIDWLKFVSSHRTKQDLTDDFDVIVGPVADDRTIDVINQYIAGSYKEDIALQLLLPQKLKDQWVMKTQGAINAISFKECIIL